MIREHLWLQIHKLGAGLSARLFLEIAYHLLLIRSFEGAALHLACEIEHILPRPDVMIEVVDADFIHEEVCVGE